MKIAIVTYSLLIGGVESVIFNLAISFQKKGHIVEVIETESSGEWKNYFIDNHLVVKSLRLNMLTVPVIHVRRIAYYLKSFDYILVNDAPYAQAGIGLLKNTTKVFPILHNNIESMIKCALSGYGQWNKVICVSPKLKTVIDNRIGKGLATFIPNGIEPLGYIKRNYDGPINFLYVGRIEDNQKGVFLLPKIALLLKENNIDFTIEVIGDGPSLQELVHIITDLKIDNIINLRKALPHETVIKRMYDNHFLLLPSNYEGMPVTLLEAMSCGLIPIVSYLPGHTNICIKENITGFFGLPGQPDSFVRAIEKAFANRQLLDQISKNASNFISKKYSISDMADLYLKVIQVNNDKIKRNNRIDYTILPEYPHFPLIISKVISKISRAVNLHKK